MLPSQTTGSGHGLTLITGVGRSVTSRREVETWSRRTALEADDQHNRVTDD